MKGFLSVLLFLVSYVLHFGSFLISILCNSLQSPRVWYKRLTWRAGVKILLASVPLMFLGLMLSSPLYGSITFLVILPVIVIVKGGEVTTTRGDKVLYSLVAVAAITSLIAAPGRQQRAPQGLGNTAFMGIMWFTSVSCWKIPKRSSVAAVASGTSLSIVFVCLSAIGNMLHKRDFNFVNFCVQTGEILTALFIYSENLMSAFSGNSWISSALLYASNMMSILTWMVFIDKSFTDSGNLEVCSFSVISLILLVGIILRKKLRTQGSRSRERYYAEQEMVMEMGVQFEEIDDNDLL